MNEKRPPTDDERLGIASAATLGIIRRWDCGCAEVDDRGVVREQPAIFCDGFEAHGHKARVVSGREEDKQGRLF